MTISDQRCPSSGCELCGLPHDAKELLDAATIKAEANADSMRLMQRLLRLLLPGRAQGCLCDGCVASEIEIARQMH
jgi:hypothetical protein